MAEHTAWGLVWATGGWMAAQLTLLGRDYLSRRRAKKAIDTELRQLYEETERLWHVYSRSLQIHTVGGIDGEAALPLSNFIFANYYKEAALIFNKVQRIAIQMIHGHIASLNEGAKRLTNIYWEIQTATLREGKCPAAEADLYGRQLKSLLMEIGITRWHIHHYVTHPIFPELGIWDGTHADYLNHLDKVDKDIQGVIDSAAGLTMEDFSKPHPLQKKAPPDGGAMY